MNDQSILDDSAGGKKSKLSTSLNNLITPSSADVFDFNTLPDELLDNSDNTGVTDNSFSNIYNDGCLPSTSSYVLSNGVLSSSGGGPGGGPGGQGGGPGPGPGVRMSSQQSTSQQQISSPISSSFSPPLHSVSLANSGQAGGGPGNLPMGAQQHGNPPTPGGNVYGGPQNSGGGPGGGGGLPSSLANNPTVLQKLLLNRMPTAHQPNSASNPGGPGGQQQPQTPISTNNNTNSNVNVVNNMNIAQQHQQQMVSPNAIRQQSMVQPPPGSQQQPPQAQQMVFNNMRSPVGGLGSPPTPGGGPGGPRVPANLGYSVGAPLSQQNAMGILPPQYSQRPQMMGQAPMQGMMPGPRSGMMNGPSQMHCGPMPPVGMRMSRAAAAAANQGMSGNMVHISPHHVPNNIPPQSTGPPSSMMQQSVNGPSLMMPRMTHIGPGGCSRYQEPSPHFSGGGMMNQQQSMRLAAHSSDIQQMHQQQQAAMMSAYSPNVQSQRPVLPPYSSGNNMNNMPNNVYSNGSMVGPPGTPGQPPSLLASPNSNMMTMGNAQQPNPGGGPQSSMNGAGPGPGPGGMPPQAVGSAQDPEKRKLIQQQLVLLLHAHKCQQRERDPAAGGQQRECSLPHCHTMKSVLTHMTTCEEGRQCTFPHCASSRQIIAHWKGCTRQDCPVCLPLKQMTDNKRPAGSGSSGSSGINSLALNDGAGAPGFMPLGRLSSGPGGPPSNVMFNGRGNDDPRVMLGLGESGYPLSSSADGMCLGSHGSMPNLPPPEGIQISKDWHKQVTQDLRNHLVSKLVKAIFPSPDPAAMQDHRIKDLINYARKVEREMFEQANDREEYYHLLAEKIYKIQKELQEKKAKRLEQAKGMPVEFSSSASSSASSVASNLQIFKTLDSTVPPNRTVPMDSSNRPLSGANMSSQSGAFGVSASQMPSNKAALSSPSSNVRPDDSDVPSRPEVKLEPAVKAEPPDEICGDAEKASTVGPSTSNVSTAGSTAPSSLTAASDTSATTSDNKPSTSVSASSSTTTATSVKQPTNKKVFTRDELCSALLPVWEKLASMEESFFFRDPVDPEKLNIPNYFDVIKNPMDLSTIRQKMTNGVYKDHWEFCNDIWLMFDNAWLYNPKKTRVYKFCTRLSEVFGEEIDPVMRSAGYCCGRRLSFTPLALVCYGQPMCAIPRDSYYYCYETKSQFGVSSERYTYCKKCFEELPGESINLSEDPNSNNVIYKSQFQHLKNDHIEYEPYVNCVECGRQWHQICALHLDQIWPSGFVCDNCLKTKSKKKPENRLTAKRLPHCKLSQHLENRVNHFLKKKDGCQGVEVIIRVLASSDKEVEVKPYVKSKFCATGEIPEKFPYRSKAIFAFEVIDGAEVCFFGLHVQEYSDKAPQPDSRRVYIAYLDSVHFFQPKHCRTNVYHEILLGYLEYCKSLGYTMAHIWACPPSEGDDYIFHCHPIEQKIPKPKRLQDWYKKMLDRGIVERTVVDYKDIHKQAQDDNLQSPTELPYFEGDYWPNVLEDCIKELENEEAERRREAEIQAVSESNAEDADDDIDDFPGAGGKKKNFKGQKKHKNKMKSSQYKKNKKAGSSGASSSGNQLTDKILAAMEKHKEVFFVVRLHSVHSAASLGPVNDPDQLISCELMDGRDNFLSTARERHWEFSSLRRAKWSTLALCYELHTQGQDKFTYTCNACKNSNAQWHCTTCEDFDLCQSCYEKTNHQHKMEQQKSLLQDEVAGGEQASQNSRTESIQRCISSLVHSCQCRDANCRRLSCHKMKRVVQHTRICKKRQNGPCLVCKQLIALCCYHAKHCQEQQCNVPFCPNIRQKLAEQAAQLKKKREREMVRRIQLMGGTPQQQPTGAPHNMPSGSAGGTGGPHTPLYQHPQQSPSLMGHNPPTPGPSSIQSVAPPVMTNVPQNAVLAAKEVERLAAVQQSGRYGMMGGPGGQPMAMNRMGQQQQPQQQSMMGMGMMASRSMPPQMAHNFSWDGGGGPMTPPNAIISSVPMQPPQYGNFRPMNHQMKTGGGPPPNVAVGPGGPNPGNVHQGGPGGGGPQQKPLQLRMQELFQALKNAKTESEQTEIMQIMSKDPPLMQAFIQLRNSNLQQQQQQKQQQQQQNAAATSGGMQNPQQMMSGGPGGPGPHPQQMWSNAGPSPMMGPSSQPQRFYSAARPPSQRPPSMPTMYDAGPPMMRQQPQYQGSFGGPQVGPYGAPAGLRQAMSPQQQNFFQQHRSPPPGSSVAAGLMTGGGPVPVPQQQQQGQPQLQAQQHTPQQVQVQSPMPSPSPHLSSQSGAAVNTNSPHVTAMQQQQSSSASNASSASTLHHLLDNSGQGQQPPDMTGSDQGKFL